MSIILTIAVLLEEITVLLSTNGLIDGRGRAQLQLIGLLLGGEKILQSLNGDRVDILGLSERIRLD